MRPITVSWVLTALIVSAAAAPIPAVGPAIGSVERRMEHEVPVFSFKDYTRQPIPPPEERSQIEEAALLEARRLHIINHFPATLTYPDGTPIRSEKRSESLEKQQPALVARTPSVSASQPSVQLLAARAPAPTPAPGEHKEWTQHGDEICGALGQHGTYGQRKVTALTGEDAKYVMGVAQSDILRRSPHKSACGHYDRGQKMTFKPLAKRREELPSKEFGYAMKELGPITPMDYNPSRSKKMHSGVAALVDDEPVTKHNHKHNQYKSGAGYQTVNINELDRVPLPLSQLTGLGPEVKGTFHGFKRRAALEGEA
ncbi:hypothetical protein IE81DRAFT_103609 [Ceraceosorus guamensis]|uniref:Uncharacterized protein n=1 Tax=Ceraceosorus guamensis TaxID=1522189 RepID=A0A316W3A6_9BASI|nr:hypothetical protein IE81DRAFT_103609 [Ceraceosorus guamensis]PWN43081.1 hypothetical protein IE81DRAFT_103609 [Ceraceosorus guamensis]